MTAAKRLRAAIAKAQDFSSWKPGGTIYCPDGHSLAGYSGDAEEAAAMIDRLKRNSGRLAVYCTECCTVIDDDDDVIVRQRRKPQAPEHVTVSIADLEELLSKVTP